MEYFIPNKAQIYLRQCARRKRLVNIHMYIIYILEVKTCKLSARQILSSFSCFEFAMNLLIYSNMLTHAKKKSRCHTDTLRKVKPFMKLNNLSPGGFLYWVQYGKTPNLQIVAIV